MDLDHELKVTGAANIIAAPLGGLVGCLALSRTLLNHKAGATSRVSGILAACCSAAILLAGAASISYLPRSVLGGLLLYLGIGLMLEWIYDGWFKFSRFDYSLVVCIVLIIAFWGFLPGVGIGLVVACMLFAFNYSRINVIKYALSGTNYSSNVERSFRQHRVLEERGEQVHIIRLQGYIFFGTAYPLLLEVLKRIQAPDKTKVRYLFLDFSFVSGIDSSSVLSFSKMKQIAEANRVKLIFVHLRPDIQKLLAEGKCVPRPGREGSTEPDRECQVFPDLDYALGWCENRILEEAKALETGEQSFEDHFAELFGKPELAARLKQYLEKVEAPSGKVLFKQGAFAEDLYFVEAGEVTAYLELPDGSRKRLRSMGAGTVVGEMGLFLGHPRSATVITELPGRFYRLTAAMLKKLEAEDLELANALHRFMVKLLADRLAHANEEIAHLLE